MAFLSQDELKTHLYEEITNEITRDDDDIIDQAIATAIDEAKGYLSKYDLAATFDDVEPAERNRSLLSTVKDMAAWHLIKLSNPNIELKWRRMLYEDALAWLRGVQKGSIAPALPLPTANTDASGTTGETDGAIKWKSNPKRNNHF